MSQHLEHAASGVASVVAKNAPPAVVTSLSLLGVPLQEWVYMATLLWIVYQFCMDVCERWKGEQ